MLGERDPRTGVPGLPDAQVGLDLHAGPGPPRQLIGARLAVPVALAVAALQAQSGAQSRERRLDGACAGVADTGPHEAERGADGDRRVEMDTQRAGPRPLDRARAATEEFEEFLDEHPIADVDSHRRSDLIVKPLSDVA